VEEIDPKTLEMNIGEMEQVGWYAVFFASALFFSVVTFGLLLRFVKTLGVRNLDELNMIRWSSSTKPSLGGLGFYIIFLLSFTVLSILGVDGVNVVNKRLFGVFGACSMAFLIGLADDAYDTRPLMKFLGQTSCAVILIATGLVIEISGSEVFNWIFTGLWVVGMMNSLNMLDNMDGITASVSVSALIGALAFALPGQGIQPFALLIYGVLAALIGFLYFNWHPSKMYMGDTGSMFLGVFLAAVGIVYFWGNKAPTGEFIQIRQFLIPLMAFIMPITDSVTVFIRRIARGQSPFVGGKDHTTHQLAFLGLPDAAVAAVFAIFSIAGVCVAWWINNNADTWSYSQTLLVVIGFLVFFGLMQVCYELGKRRYQARQLLENTDLKQNLPTGS
jgi:UDP-GlcNAc:undecaprenyl-phosphate GlcNAc-1-phosphate transferase